MANPFKRFILSEDELTRLLNRKPSNAELLAFTEKKKKDYKSLEEQI